VSSSLIEPKTHEGAEELSPNQLPPSLLKVGMLAAASALAGGLAAAWYYRKILARLRQAEAVGPDENEPSENGAVDDL
jgi:hypothetical protein